MKPIRILTVLLVCFALVAPNNIYPLAPSSKISRLAGGKLEVSGRGTDNGSDSQLLPAWLRGITARIEEQPSTRPEFIPELPFPNMETGAGVREPEWLELSLIGAAILVHNPAQGKPGIILRDLKETTQKYFEMHGLKFRNSKFIRQLNVLRANDIISNYGTDGAEDGEFVSVNEEAYVGLDLPPRMMAVWANDIDFIRRDLEDSVLEDRVVEVAVEYAGASAHWPYYPVEMNYPVLKALAVSDNSVRAQIHKSLDKEFWGKRRLPLIDSILLLYDEQERYPERGWLETQVSGLEGRRVYMAAPEISLLAGGLGRVMLYHGEAMKRLKANVIFIEPDYRHDKGGSELDYSDGKSVPVPMRGDEEWGVLDTIVRGQKVKFRVRVGQNQYGIPVYRIRDVIPHQAGAGYVPFVDVLYRYRSDAYPNSIDMELFSEFFSKATIELVRRLEERAHAEEGEDWKPPVVQAHDGQVLPATLFHRAFYAHQEDGVSQGEIDILEQMFIMGTTHTYRNRGIIGQWQLIEDYYNQVEHIGIPEEFLWTFARRATDGTNRRVWDFTSGGIRGAGVGQAVSAIHAHEVSQIDPGVQLYALTNGSNRTFSTEYFRRAAGELVQRFQPETFTPQKVAKAKRKAKIRISEGIAGVKLDPDKMVVSYSGRWVPEKAGRETAFSNENIERMVKAGIQVVLFGNVQDNTISQNLGKEMISLAASIREKKELNPEWKDAGTLIFLPSFKIDDQLQLLAATDVQVQYSTRGTGAAEYTESDVTSNGGLQLSPPFWEGIIGRQGIPINWENLTGNTLVPSEDTSEAFLRTIMRAKELFDSEDPERNLSVLQAQSLRISRVLEAKLTGAAYLRVMNDFIERGVRLTPARPFAELKYDNIQEIKVDVPPGVTWEEIPGGINVIGKGTARLEVRISHTATNELRSDVQEVIPPELILARLVDHRGKVMNLRHKRHEDGSIVVENGAVLFEGDIKRYPFEGYLEISSGMWWTREPLSIKNGLSQEVMQRVEALPASDFKVRSVSPVEMLRGDRILYKENTPVVLEVEFPWNDEESRDRVVPVLHSNVFGDWDDVSVDQLLYSELRYEKKRRPDGTVRGGFVWQVGFIPKQSGEFTFYLTLKRDPQYKHWYRGHSGNIRITEKIIPEGDSRVLDTGQSALSASLQQSGETVRLVALSIASMEIENHVVIPSALIKAGYYLRDQDLREGDEKVRLEGGERALRMRLKAGESRSYTFDPSPAAPAYVAHKDVEGDFAKVKQNLETLFPDAAFPSLEDVEDLDRDTVTDDFLRHPLAKNNEDLVTILSLVGDVVEGQAPSMPQDLKYKVAVTFAKQLLGINFVLPPARLKILWDELAGLGYGVDFYAIAQAVARIEGKTIPQLEEEELAVVYFLSAIRGDKTIREGLPSVTHKVSDSAEFVGRLHNVVVQYKKVERMIETLEGMDYSGSIVLSVKDVDAGFYNFVQALDRYGVNMESVKIVLLLRGLSQEERIRWMRNKPPHVLFAEDIEDVEDLNIVYVANPMEEDASRRLRMRKIKLLVDGKAGPMLELSLALELLTLGNIYETGSLKPGERAIDLFKNYLGRLTDQEIIDGDEGTLDLLANTIAESGIFTAPEVSAFTDLWKQLDASRGVDNAL